MLSMAESRISFDRIMQQGKILLVNTAKGAIGENKANSSVA
jgi:hypothetical protein